MCLGPLPVCLFVCLFDWLVMLWRQECLFNTWLPAAEWELPEKCGIFGHLAFAFPVLDNNQNPLWWFSLFVFISTSFALCSPDVVWWLKWIHATLTANAKINKHDSTTFGHLLLECTLHKGSRVMMKSDVMIVMTVNWCCCPQSFDIG